MGERSTENQFGLSEGRDIDKQAPHMHKYRSAAQRGHHYTHLRQLHHCATGAREYQGYVSPLLLAHAPKAVAAP